VQFAAWEWYKALNTAKENADAEGQTLDDVNKMLTDPNNSEQHQAKIPEDVKRQEKACKKLGAEAGSQAATDLILGGAHP
jgi:hypothetical protein